MPTHAHSVPRTSCRFAALLALPVVAALTQLVDFYTAWHNAAPDIGADV